MYLRRILLASLVALSAAQLPACGVTAWQRQQDAFDAQVRAAQADLNSPEMTARICAAGAMTSACGWHQ